MCESGYKKKERKALNSSLYSLTHRNTRTIKLVSLRVRLVGTRFFYPLRKQWYIITRSVYIINRRLHNHFRNDEIQRLSPLVIFNFCGIDDMHGFAVIFARF